MYIRNIVAISFGLCIDQSKKYIFQDYETPYLNTVGMNVIC